MEFSADKLKYMAAEVVSNYLANHIPLSDAVAEKAGSLKLNSEQVKRLVEISNQVAYLKLLEKATDRTFEFPLAKYSEVMAILATPDENMSKEASYKPGPMEIVSGAKGELEKVASVKEDDQFGFLKRASKQEKIALLNKEMYRVKGDLEKIASQEQVLVRELLSQGLDLKEDPQFMDKIAMVLEDEEEYITKIAKLVYGEPRDYMRDELFYDSDVEDARNYVGMFKQAEELIETKNTLEDRIERAESFLKKQAMAGSLAGALIADKAKKKGAKDVASGLAHKGLKGVESYFVAAENIARPKADILKSLH